jgi:hypothetical protein
MLPRRLPSFLRWFAIALLGLSLTGCADSPEKVMDDQISAMEDLTGIVEKVADGSLASSEAAKEIAEVRKRTENLRARAEKLGDKLTTAKPDKNQQEKMKSAMREMFGAMAKLQTSGRATKELRDALDKIGTKE